ncbi:unnamed protein product [Phytophthora lilii]|uniref:Unnamed protein product n=1 Tax=Phytophthora lilii TaxID=2077276 RepID=A0A9W6WMK8_9STRA|nr:unnamed protein product [Phytophthora lilii]
MDALEALKNEGNTLFQQKRFAEAVQVYSSVLDELQGSDADVVRLGTAVRLNRAWALIQLPANESEDDTLAAAEKDCSAVIEMDPSCVKAFYRRALARERRGLLKDAAAMKRLEPANPSANLLLERLQQNEEAAEVLAPNFQQCTIHSDSQGNSDASTTAPTISLAEEAERAWRALQTDETNFQKVYKTTAKPRRKPKRTAKDKRAVQSDFQAKGKISEKTDDLWESLRREEVTTVAKAFPRSKRQTAS